MAAGLECESQSTCVTFSDLIENPSGYATVSGLPYREEKNVSGHDEVYGPSCTLTLIRP